MVRRIIAFIAGIAVAVALVMIIQKLGHSLFPPPTDLDPADREFMEAYVANLPWGPLAFVIASYFAATLAGGWVAGTVAGEWPLLYAGVVGFFILAGAISTVMMIPHPAWFTIAAIAGIVIAALLAATLAARGRRRPPV